MHSFKIGADLLYLSINPFKQRFCPFAAANGQQTDPSSKQLFAPICFQLHHPLIFGDLWPLSGICLLTFCGKRGRTFLASPLFVILFRLKWAPKRTMGFTNSPLPSYKTDGLVCCFSKYRRHLMEWGACIEVPKRNSHRFDPAKMIGFVDLRFNPFCLFAFSMLK